MWHIWQKEKKFKILQKKIEQAQWEPKHESKTIIPYSLITVKNWECWKHQTSSNKGKCCAPPESWSKYTTGESPE